MAGHLIYVRTFHIWGKYVLQHIRDLKRRKPFRAAPPKGDLHCYTIVSRNARHALVSPICCSISLNLALPTIG